MYVNDSIVGALGILNGSLAGAVYLQENISGVLQRAQAGQEPIVEF